MSSSKRFDQSRKEDAERHASTVRRLLADYYDIKEKLIVSVESIHDGAYDTGGKFDAAHFLDYAGVDWLVDDRPAIVAIGERLRPVKDGGTVDFSWRVNNGTSRPCEAVRVPAGLERVGGVAPETILFGRYDSTNIRRAWLVDVESLLQLVESGVGEVYDSPGGARARYISVPDLVTQNAVCDAWEVGVDD